MRPKIPNSKEVSTFFKTATNEQKQEAVATLFDMSGDDAIPYPRNQYELVVHTLIFHDRNKELTMSTWMTQYRTHKWSSRLGQVEGRSVRQSLDTTLVNRRAKSFVNRFGHDSYYTVYEPLLTREQYIKLYFEMREKIKK